MPAVGWPEPVATRVPTPYPSIGASASAAMTYSSRSLVTMMRVPVAPSFIASSRFSGIGSIARICPAPAIRARRRVETPPGAQAQVDWAEFPDVVLGHELVDLVALVMTLSWSRKRAVVWARSKDMLSWQACQMACFRRLGGAPAVLRIDNVKTAIAKGAGAWPACARKLGLPR